jgi:triphosphoribosyl-dephospho-CoA synthase
MPHIAVSHLSRVSRRVPDAADVASAAQLACLLEASAPKPGNVAPGVAFHDTRYEDFLASAAAIGPALLAAATAPLGATIRRAIESTAHWTRANTNLGIVLLLAPLARAALTPPTKEGDGEGEGEGEGTEPLRARLTRVLASTTVDDAADVYAAIRLARPGGLGTAAEQDVAAPPTVALRDAMALAAERDTIAREYVTDFAVTFETGAPALERARREGLSWSDAVVETYLTLLAAVPDTHIARKLGMDDAAALSVRARDVLAAGGVRTPRGREAVARLDEALRDARNARNPGTTADLTAASIYVALLGGAWQRRPGGN